MVLDEFHGMNNHSFSLRIKAWQVLELINQVVFRKEWRNLANTNLLVKKACKSWVWLFFEILEKNWGFCKKSIRMGARWDYCKAFELSLESSAFFAFVFDIAIRVWTKLWLIFPVLLTKGANDPFLATISNVESVLPSDQRRAALTQVLL